MTLNSEISVRLVGDLQPAVTKAMLIDLIKKHRIKESDMLDTLTDFKVLNIVEERMPKNREEQFEVR